MQGYIKLYRVLLQNKLWTSEPFTKGQAWIDLLLLANHKEGFIKTRNGEMIKITRGECGYSKEALAARWRWSRGKVTRYIEFLEKSEKMIHQKKYPKTTIIAILNYEKYQDDTSNGHQTDTNNNEENKSPIIESNTHTLYNGDFKKNRVCVSSLNSEEFEILRNYAKKSRANNEYAYVHSLIRNGGYRDILERERKTREILKKQAESMQERDEEQKESALKSEIDKIRTKAEAIDFLKLRCNNPKFIWHIPPLKKLAIKFDIKESELRCRN